MKARWIQIYSRKPLPDEFAMHGDPYVDPKQPQDVQDASKAFAELMRAGGNILFYRDEFHTEGAFFVKIDEPVDGCYSQFRVNESGAVERYIMQNVPVKVMWITDKQVKRLMM